MCMYTSVACRLDGSRRRFLDARRTFRASMYVRVSSFRANTHERVYARETGRDNICRDLHACPRLAGRYFRIVMPPRPGPLAVARDEAAYP